MSKLGIPSVNEILESGIRKTLKKNKVHDLGDLMKKSGMSKAIAEVERAAHEIYLEKEREAVAGQLMNKGISKEEAVPILQVFIEEKLATRIANVRRSRGGNTSEKIVRRFLRTAGFSCERGKKTRGGYRPDLVVPSNEVLQKSPEKAVAIAVKRTFRERWAEDIDVFQFQHGIFILLVADPDFNESKARDMVDRGMKEVYISDEIYSKSKDFITSQFKKHSDLVGNLREMTGIDSQ